VLPTVNAGGSLSCVSQLRFKFQKFETRIEGKSGQSWVTWPSDPSSFMNFELREANTCVRPKYF
jgi:hypothetical protein